MRARSLFASTVLASVLLGCGGDSEPVVGVLLPMSGKTATFGQESWNGMQIAYDEIKAKDAAFGLKLVLADEQSRKDMVGPQTKKLLENDGARIVVGSVASSNTMEAALVCKNAGIPLLTPASTNDALTDDPATYGKDVFRVCFKDAHQGGALARFSQKTLKAKKAVAVVDEGSAYARGLADNFQKEFERLGGTVEREYYSENDLEYKTLVQKVADRKPDVVLVAGYYGQAGPMVRSAKSAWKDIPVVGGDGLDSPVMLEQLQGVDVKVYCSSHFVASDTDPLVATFVAKYKARYDGQVPGAMAALGYDAMYAVHEAFKRSKAAHSDSPYDPKHLAEALRGLEFTGVTGKIKIGEDRTPKKPLVMVRARDTFEFVERVEPE
jgi:branched-chain amino acid transport system substrate-binding protein